MALPALHVGRFPALRSIRAGIRSLKDRSMPSEMLLHGITLGVWRRRGSGV